MITISLRGEIFKQLTRHCFTMLRTNTYKKMNQPTNIASQRCSRLLETQGARALCQRKDTPERQQRAYIRSRRVNSDLIKAPQAS